MKGSDFNLRRELQSATKRGVSWVAQRQEQNGEFNGCAKELVAYYKVLLLFAFCGLHDPGVRCLNYVKQNLLNNKGELCTGNLKTTFLRMQRNLANYMDGWVAIGSWFLGDYEFANSISLLLKSQQSAYHGGVLTGPEKWAGRPRYDLATTASCGRAFFFTGHHDAALKAADFLKEALKHQSDLKLELDLCFDDRWNRVDAPDPQERTYYRLDHTSRGEKVWFPAFSSAFLCEIFQVKKDIAYLEAAKEYFKIVEATPEFREGTLANGKSGWAAGLLGLATKEKKHVESLRLIVPNVLARQKEDGEFGPSPRSSATQRNTSAGGRDISNVPLARRLETTAEFTIWSAQYLRMYSWGLWNE